MDFSKFFSMDKKDILNALGTLVFSAVVGTLYTVSTTPGFSFSEADWGMIFNMMVVAVLTSVFKSAGTTSDGKLLGVLKTK